MPEMKPEVLEKITVALSGEEETYNQFLKFVTDSKSESEKAEQEKTALQAEVTQHKEQGSKYLSQISNLLGQLPAGNANRPESYEEKRKAIKDRPWTK